MKVTKFIFRSPNNVVGDFWNKRIDIVILTSLAKHIYCGQIAAWLAKTCRHMRDLVYKTERLVVLMRYHVIETVDLNHTITVERGTIPVKERPPRLIFDTLTSILWFKHGFNYPLSIKMMMEPFMYLKEASQLRFLHKDSDPNLHVFRFCNVLLTMKGNIEGMSEHVDDKGNVMLLTDHYGSDFTRCRKSDFDTPEKFERCLASDIKDLSTFEFLKELFPGTFDWRLIHFPFNPNVRETVAYNRYFHRATCLQLFFRASGIIADKELVKSLKKINLPTQCLFIYKKKDNKKRKLDNDSYALSKRVWQIPPTTEMRLLKRALASKIKNQVTFYIHFSRVFHSRSSRTPSNSMRLSDTCSRTIQQTDLWCN